MVIIGIILILIDTFTFDLNDMPESAKNPTLYIYTKYIYRKAWQSFLFGDFSNFVGPPTPPPSAAHFL